jgi:hypothetical protein
LTEIKTPTSVFAPDEVVEFKDTAHSNYDSCTAFNFISLPSRELKTWFLYDDDPDNSAQLFAPIE